MALIEEFDKTGNWLFRRRSYLPLFLYVFATIVLFIEQKEFLEFTNIYWILACYAVSVLGLIIRILVVGYTPKATSGRNTKKQVANEINTKGIYSVVRHPLYLGNFFMWLGIIIYVGNGWFIAVCILLFWLYYERIMFAEEMFVRSKFSKEYEKWSENTPAFFPKFRKWDKTDLNFSIKNVLKREYGGFFATIISFAYIDFLKNYLIYDKFYLDFLWMIFLIAGFVIFIVLRTLKKSTKVLDVSGR
ncbi:MAG: DUF1295 domain-containing protein [Bacteroidetes bacterium]|jgi:protein-S-isoprenylcysteine O-methyltransferase Ste14|nr:DUF1295 domain-containing protein [Bacteroidota bacterium]MBT6686112.1 DUF1295 domain-containing protein [Bacteroidota bacterium]MBT7143256.1 DUF1295 domain-containing protein [Bacteroidota bacterium]MBT7493398.1 DUF1295 domain-containing protein [Bacteroidota bacterium]